MTNRLLSTLLCAAIALMLNLHVGHAFASSEKKEEGGEKAGGVGSEYVEIKPALIANYGGPGPIHFLKADISLRVSKDTDAALNVLHHMPHIRHELVMLFSKQTDDSLSTMEGKEQLRADALAAVKKVVKDEEGKDLVEDLLFTNFIVQR